MSLAKMAVVGSVMLALALLVPQAAAHDGEVFTVILRSDGPVPASFTIDENVSVLWINGDDTENVTHRILLDVDGDGVFNGSADIDSGELQSECEKDENGTLVDEECSVSFELTFNGTLTNSTFAYQDRLSSGVTNNGNVTVILHVDDAGNGTHVHDASHTHGEAPAEEDEGREKPAWLLWVAGLSAGGAALLALMLRRAGS